MLGKPRIRLNNLKTRIRFPCLGLNPIRDFIIVTCLYIYLFQLSNNPITLEGPLAALSLLQKSETSVLEELEFAVSFFFPNFVVAYLFV